MSCSSTTRAMTAAPSPDQITREHPPTHPGRPAWYGQECDLLVTLLAEIVVTVAKEQTSEQSIQT